MAKLESLTLSEQTAFDSPPHFSEWEEMLLISLYRLGFNTLKSAVNHTMDGVRQQRLSHKRIKR